MVGEGGGGDGGGSTRLVKLQLFGLGSPPNTRDSLGALQKTKAYVLQMLVMP